MTATGDDGGRGTRDRILTHLRRGRATVEDLSRAIDVTPNSIRVQLAQLERDGQVRRDGVRRTSRKPAHLFALSAEAERGFSNAYVPVLATLLRVLGERVALEVLSDALREVGRRLARPRARRSADFDERVDDALRVLAELGGIAEVEHRDGSVIVSGHGCPLGEIVRQEPQVCTALESLLGEITGAAVRECCDRTDRPSCRFVIERPDHAA
jgi:predicted ArsR family transcriptional regulator